MNGEEMDALHIHAQDENGDTALACASQQGHLDIVAMLESKTAIGLRRISSPDLVAAAWASLITVPPPLPLPSPSP